jgi:hypothetical protein
MAEAAEILTRKAGQFRRESRNDVEEKSLAYDAAAIALSWLSRELPDGRIDQLLERENA